MSICGNHLAGFHTSIPGSAYSKQAKYCRLKRVMCACLLSNMRELMLKDLCSQNLWLDNQCYYCIAQWNACLIFLICKGQGPFCHLNGFHYLLNNIPRHTSYQFEMFYEPSDLEYWDQLALESWTAASCAWRGPRGRENSLKQSVGWEDSYFIQRLYWSELHLHSSAALSYNQLNVWVRKTDVQKF